LKKQCLISREILRPESTSIHEAESERGQQVNEPVITAVYSISEEPEKEQ
jgi:hypothetical protein